MSTTETQSAAGGLIGIPDFWERLADAPHRLLAIDYDGTLAPFKANRMEAVPLPQSIAALKSIIDKGHAVVAIVSGRPLAELYQLLPDWPIAMIGSHGWEVRHPNGITADMGVSSIQRQGLSDAYDLAREFLPEDLVERKIASVAAHTRPLEPDQAKAVQEKIAERWDKLLVPNELQWRRFNGGLELRALGHHKGTAVKQLLKDADPTSVTVYIGDDDTDEDAFNALRPGDIGIKVGAPDPDSNARGFLKDCQAVADFLTVCAEKI